MTSVGFSTSVVANDEDKTHLVDVLTRPAGKWNPSRK